MTKHQITMVYGTNTSQSVGVGGHHFNKLVY